MALHFNFSKVHDHQRVTTNPADPEEWHPVADALVWLSMICGFNRIDEKNYDRVALRIAAYQVVAGAYLGRIVLGKRSPVYITPQDVKRFIGMTTNATVMTDAQWLKHLGKLAMDAAGRTDHWTGKADFPSALSVLGEFTGVKVDMHEAPAQPVGG